MSVIVLQQSDGPREGHTVVMHGQKAAGCRCSAQRFSHDRLLFRRSYQDGIERPDVERPDVWGAGDVEEGQWW